MPQRPAPVVAVHEDAEAVAEAAATRLLARLVEAQTHHAVAHLALTGGGVGIATLRAVVRRGVHGAVDWRRVEVWWSDERFLPLGHPDRNETQAREAGLDTLDLDPARVHPMPASDGPDGEDLDAAAARYADLLTRHAPSDHDLPVFDVALLGVGADGHVASLFPEAPALHDERVCFGVHASPKPPAQRVTLGLGALRTAREVWVLAAGAEKAAMAAAALGGAGPVQVPAAGALGTHATLWVLDRAAAAHVPAGLLRR